MATMDLSKELELVNRRITTSLASEDARMQEIMDWVLLGRGKQLRPQMVLLSGQFGKMNDEVYLFASIIEILHMASLVHDDVIDNSTTRRGLESVQSKFGASMAVYAGDFMLACVIDDALDVIGLRNYKFFFRAMKKLVYGELGQVARVHDLDVTVEQYLANIEGKTSSLFEIACRSGAKAAHAPAKYEDALADFGKNYGMLFQICDDILDFSKLYMSDKPRMLDFVNGIYSLPLIYALQEHKEQIRQIQDDCDHYGMNTERSTALKELIRASGSLEKCEEKSRFYYREAMTALAKLPRIPARDTLEEMTDQLLSTTLSSSAANFAV